MLRSQLLKCPSLGGDVAMLAVVGVDASAHNAASADFVTHGLLVDSQLTIICDPQHAHCQSDIFLFRLFRSD